MSLTSKKVWPITGQRRWVYGTSRRFFLDEPETSYAYPGGMIPRWLSSFEVHFWGTLLDFPILLSFPNNHNFHLCVHAEPSTHHKLSEEETSAGLISQPLPFWGLLGLMMTLECY